MGPNRPGRGHAGTLAWLVEGLEGSESLSPLTSATEAADSTSYRLSVFNVLSVRGFNVLSVGFNVLSVLPSWWTTLADRGLPHNHHKPRLAGYKLGGSV